MTTENAQATPQSQKKSPLRWVTIILRTLFGALFIFSGLNGFFNFVKPPPDGMPQGAMDLMAAFMKTGYMLPLIFSTQLLGGVLLFINCFVPLGLAILAPIIVNIVAFHAKLAPSGLGMAIVVAIIELYLAWAYRSSFRAMLDFRAKPTN